MTVTGDDGEPIHFRAQVHGNLTQEDRDALGEIAKAAIRKMRAEPPCPNEPPCEHRMSFHTDGRCVVRWPTPCGCEPS